MKELKIGIIGYGGRISHFSKMMRKFGVPMKIQAVADPRLVEIKALNDEHLKGTNFYPDADSLLAAEKFDGIMIGTRCFMHTDMAIKAAKHKVPLFVEKPVGISLEQLRRLDKTFKNYKAPVVVSFPLRLSPLVTRAKEIIKEGLIGTVENFDGFNDVPYGAVYFSSMYRDWSKTGGLWLQKATHDLDYITYILEKKPVTIAAMSSQRIYKGTKPYDLQCKNCPEQLKCLESEYNLFYVRHAVERNEQEKTIRKCVFSKGIKNQDSGSCLLQYENGLQGTYHQNFFIKNKAARRGMRIYGYKGTVEFDWYTGEVKLYYHFKNAVEIMKFEGTDGHGGGDEELAHDFLQAMSNGKKPRAGMKDGILSALMCLKAGESCETGKFVKIKL